MSPVADRTNGNGKGAPRREPEGPRAWHSVRAALRQGLAPLADRLNCSLGCSAAGHVEWLATADDCTCAGQTVAADDPGPCGRARAREVLEVEVETESDSPLRVILCCRRADAVTREAVRRLARTAIQAAELEEAETRLLQELGTCWENLEAMGELNTAIRSPGGTVGLLDRILGRVVGMRPGAQAILWLVEDGVFEPTLARTTRPYRPMPETEGLFGRVLAERHGVILNGRAKIAPWAAPHPELAEAEAVVVTPLATQQGLFGMLEVWQEGRGAFDSRTMHLAESLASQAAMVVENERLHREQIESERLRQEVAIGSRIQQTLLLGKPPRDLSAFTVAAVSLPSRHIDGDFYDCVSHGRGVLDVVIGDVMGKGVPAALVGAATKHQLNRALSRMLVAAGGTLPEVKAVLRETSAEVAAQLTDIERFVTLCYARFDSPRRRMTFVDCGHTRTIQWCAATGALRLLAGHNTPLGFLEGEEYEEVAATFRTGDIFFFYSDGLTETTGLGGEMFGEARLAALVGEHARLGPAALIERVRATLVAYSGSDTFADDFTCVAVRIEEGGADAAGPPR